MEMGFTETTDRVSDLLGHVFTAGIYNSYHRIFRLSKCFGEREEVNPILIFKAKSILTRTNAFYIPVQLKTNLVFMMLFCIQFSAVCFICKVACPGIKAQRNITLLPHTRSKLVFLAFCLFIIWKTCC